jgi:hypothetical protein
VDVSDLEPSPDAGGTSPKELGPFPGGVRLRVFFLAMISLTLTLLWESLNFLVRLIALAALVVVVPRWAAGADLDDIALWSLWISLLCWLLDNLYTLARLRSSLLEFVRDGRAPFERPADSTRRAVLRDIATRGLVSAVVFALEMPDLHSALTLTGVSAIAAGASTSVLPLGGWTVRRLRRRSS